MKRKIANILFVIMIIVFTFYTPIFARDNTALSVATAYEEKTNTLDACNNAAQCYYDAGYTSYIGCDLDASMLYSYLYADVQFFCTHGAYDNIKYETTGIAKGDGITIGNRQYIGTNQVHWYADTILVTYVSCEGAKDSSLDTIAGATWQRGADTVLAFNKEIDLSTATSWSNRYNKKLQEGSTVYEAAAYANSFIYLYPSIKSLTIYGNSDLTIGGTNSRATSMSNKIYKDSKIIYDINNEKNNNITLDNAISSIKDKYRSNSLNNYEIVRTDGITKIKNSEIYENEQEEYVDVVLKIGEFYTNKGYTICLKGGIVQQIYDNNTPTTEELNILQNSEIANTTINDKEVKSLKLKAIRETQSKYKENNLKIDYAATNTKLFYDIEKDKKYIAIEVKSTVNDNISTEAVAYDTMFYEI